MLRQPRFKSHLRLDVPRSDLVVVRREDGHVVHRGKLLPLLVPLLDGSRTIGEVAEALAGRANVLDVRFGISQLEEAGHLTEGDDPTSQDLVAFRDALGAEADDFRRRLTETAVRVSRSAGWISAPLASALESLGIEVARSDAANLEVVMASDYLHPELAEIDRRMRRLARSWLPVKPVGAVLWIGPGLPPDPAAGSGGC